MRIRFTSSSVLFVKIIGVIAEAACSFIPFKLNVKAAVLVCLFVRRLASLMPAKLL
ncbi:hypothetical protein MOE37_20040 [Bacillus atrophaeus]|uniref:hypothetical protein n=1 Tax=Bacillus atrophaeus TaxID=1452 RepID=UPI002281ED70|nr:hypothetical protein [Bacillus atrophaeus]